MKQFLILAMLFVLALPLLAQPAPVTGTLTDVYFTNVANDTHVPLYVLGLMPGYPDVYFESTITMVREGTGDTQVKTIRFILRNVMTPDNAYILQPIYEVNTWTNQNTLPKCDLYFVPTLYEEPAGLVTVRVTPRNCGPYTISAKMNWIKSYVIPAWDFGQVVYQH